MLRGSTNQDNGNPSSPQVVHSRRHEPCFTSNSHAFFQATLLHAYTSRRASIKVSIVVILNQQSRVDLK